MNIKEGWMIKKIKPFEKGNLKLTAKFPVIFRKIPTEV